MRLLTAFAIGFAAVAAPAASAPETAAATSEDARFQAFGDRVVDEYLKLSQSTRRSSATIVTTP